jgi:ribosomal protein S18 acetylase RimI-like enzyme
MSTMLQTRAAIPDDAALISMHRKAMFASMHIAEEAVLETVRLHHETWVKRTMLEGKYIGWIVCEDTTPVASAGFLILDWPPHPFDPAGERRGYLLNVYVEPEFRKRGLARELTKLCLAEAGHRGIRVVTLHASAAGRPVYKALGFHPTSEMMYVEPASKLTAQRTESQGPESS